MPKLIRFKTCTLVLSKILAQVWCGNEFTGSRTEALDISDKEPKPVIDKVVSGGKDGIVIPIQTTQTRNKLYYYIVFSVNMQLLRQRS